MADIPTFAELAARPDPRLDELSLALAAAFRTVDSSAALSALDLLAIEVAAAAEGADGDAEAEVAACVGVLARAHGFTGDRETYDHPHNSMLDVVLRRRRGLPILLSIVYVEVARRAGIPLAGIGLPGHFVVGHTSTGADRPLLLDPFAGGELIHPDVPGPLLRPWPATEIAMRMLNNLKLTYERRGDVAATLRAAELRLALPADPTTRATLELELQGVRSRLN